MTNLTKKNSLRILRKGSKRNKQRNLPKILMSDEKVAVKVLQPFIFFRAMSCVKRDLFSKNDYCVVLKSIIE